MPCTTTSEPQDALVIANPSLYKFWVEVNRRDEAQYSLAVEKFLTSPCIQRVVDKLEALDADDQISFSLQDQSESPRVGYVYAAWNPLFADLIKIGATTRQPHVRVAELSSAGVPEPFQLIASVPSFNPFVLERKIHKHFAAVRKYGRKKEFFTLTRSEIVKYFPTLPPFELNAPKSVEKSHRTEKKRKVECSVTSGLYVKTPPKMKPKSTELSKEDLDSKSMASEGDIKSSYVANLKELLTLKPELIELFKEDLELLSKLREQAEAKHDLDVKEIANLKELLVLKPKTIELRRQELELESKARDESIELHRQELELESKARDAENAKRESDLEAFKAKLDMDLAAFKAKLDMDLEAFKAKNEEQAKELEFLKAKLDKETQAAKARDEERVKELEFLRAKAKIQADSRMAVQVSAPVDIQVPQPKTLWTIMEVALKEGITKYLQRAIQNRILAIVGKHFHGRAFPTEKVVEGTLLVYQYHMSLYDEIKAELQKTRDKICNPA